MRDILTYSGFVGSVHFSADDEVFHGKIEGIDDLVTFEGKSVDELKKAFHREVDDYLALCKKIGKETRKSYKGSLNVRISPDVHRKAALKAATMGISLNQLIQEAVKKMVWNQPAPVVCFKPFFQENPPKKTGKTGKKKVIKEPFLTG